MKNFLSYFFKTNKIKDSSIPNNAIEFLVDGNEPNIKISVIDLSDNSAKVFAKMIYDIVHGGYETDIINVLLELSLKDDDIQKFISKVLMHYSLYKTTYVTQDNYDENKSDDPIVKPTQFNKQL